MFGRDLPICGKNRYTDNDNLATDIKIRRRRTLHSNDCYIHQRPILPVRLCVTPRLVCIL